VTDAEAAVERAALEKGILVRKGKKTYHRIMLK